MKGVLVVVISALGFMAAGEVVMQPTAGDRFQLAGLFVAAAGAVAAAARWLPRWARGATRLRRTVVALSVVSTLLVAAAVAGAARLMFISGHDLRLLSIVLGFALVLGAVFAVSVGGPLTADLEQIAAAARRVGEGDLEARTRVSRPDEVGTVASALDDMTGRLAEVEAERRREQEAREAFLTSIGHDLRTPLAALRAAIEAMQDGLAPDRDRYLQSMSHDVAALTSLVDDLFLLAKIESGHLDLRMSDVDLAELADEAVEALRPMAAGSGVELVLETAGHVRASGGPEALSRVIRNLVDNAIRHSPQRGRVTVRVEGEDEALVRVVDDGPGFRPGFVDRAFDSFTRDDEARTRSGGGAGLGLAIARGFVAAHGGSIWAEHGPGGRVAFRIPARPVRSVGGRSG